MEKYVYMVRSHGNVIEKLLDENGFKYYTGDGLFKLEILSRCEVLLPGGRVTVDKKILDQAPYLRLIVKSGVGYDRIDIESCTSRGIYVANTPGTNSISVAEHTLALMLAVAKRLYPISLSLRCDHPDFWCRDRYEGMELNGKTICIVGLGNIGRRVAKLAEAFGMQVVGYDPFAKQSVVPVPVEVYTNLNEALAVADFVTLHVPGGADTFHMINTASFDCMKGDAILINASRGSVVDQDALIEALQAGKIAGAGLDVFEEEPLRPENPLIAMEHVVLTPHCAGNTGEAHLRIQYGCMENILDFYAGKRPRYAVNELS
ncbi:MAG: hydroxyacid dehydrogenase [Lachnospiraceae bacterium]|nr:hydroxyacid dehydrogenase [Lachnospiraceae bacterium]